MVLMFTHIPAARGLAISACSLLLLGSLAVAYWSRCFRPTAHRNDGSTTVSACALTAPRDAEPWVPAAIPVDGFQMSAMRVEQLVQRAGAWSQVKWGPSVDEHTVRLIPWVTRAESREAFLQCFRRLTDSAAYKEPSGLSSLLVDSPFGATFRTRRKGDLRSPIRVSADDGLGHVDAALAALAEAGFALNTTVRTEQRTYQLWDVLEDSLQRAGPNREAEWSLVAYCAYLGPQRVWANSRGERRDVNELLESILDQVPGSGPCLGAHQLWAIAYAWRKSAVAPELVNPGLVSRCRTYLEAMRDVCSRNQFGDGSWDRAWFQHSEAAAPDYGTELEASLEHLGVTGHLLEAFAILPADLRPESTSLVRGLEYLTNQLEQDPNLYFGKDFSATTHAVRALCLYAGSESSPTEMGFASELAGTLP